MNAKIKIEGQELELEEEIAQDDELLKAALAPTWPAVSTATFTRTGGKDGKQLVVTVTKRAGTKGINNELEAEDARALIVVREMEEAERVRKLEAVAVAALVCLQAHERFKVEPSLASAAFLGLLRERIDALGIEEIARIMGERALV
jgi:hypothetical protein